jgi:hypothetical protein
MEVVQDGLMKCKVCGKETKSEYARVKVQQGDQSMKTRPFIIACAVAIGWFLLTVAFFGIVPSLFMQGAVLGLTVYWLMTKAKS